MEHPPRYPPGHWVKSHNFEETLYASKRRETEGESRDARGIDENVLHEKPEYSAQRVLQ